jgi:hypothetical protein
VLVPVSIGLVTAAFVAMLGILYYYSAWKVRFHPPSALLVVEGNEHFNGATVTVEGPPPSAWCATLSADNKYGCRFHLAAGVYSVRIRFRGSTIYENPMAKISEHQYVFLKLPARSRSTTLP